MTALKGTLNDMSMVHVVQVLTISKKSGTLVLINDGIKGVVFLQHGEIVDAGIMLTLTGEVLMEGEEAFYHVMRWARARFWFYPKPISLPDYARTITTDNGHLIMEGLRQIDEEESTDQAVGDDSWVSLDPLFPANGDPGRAVNELGWHLLTLIRQGVQQVGQLAEQSGLGKLLTLMTLTDMVDVGLLRIDPCAPPSDAQRQADEVEPFMMPGMSLTADAAGDAPAPHAPAAPARRASARAVG
ncbi:MAG TPA: DUF4388 domain-containing protein, partial [Chloroflexia bacterium]|nr:DUF4388 domain-containing protein [Chloroflexia bacterium]